MEATKKNACKKNCTCLLLYNIFHIVQSKCIIKRYKVQGQTSTKMQLTEA